jgi:hypothetical protein
MTWQNDPIENAPGWQNDPVDGPQVGAVVREAVKVNPDEAARAARLNKTYPVGIDTALRNIRALELDQTVKQVESRLPEAPKLAEAIRRRPDIAMQAHDDVDRLADIERTFGGTLGDVAVTAVKGAVALPQSIVGLAGLLSGGYAGKGVEAIGIRFEDAQQFLDTLYSPAQQRSNQAVKEAEGFFDTLGAMLSNPSTVATTVGQSIPQMLGGAAIGRGLVTLAPKLAPWLAAAFGEGVMGAGAAAEQMREQDDDGLLSARTTFAALGSGAGTALFGAVGGRAAQRLGLADVDTALVARGVDGEAAQAVKSSFIGALAKAGVSEGVFEELPQSIQEQMWQNWGTGRPLGEGVGAAAAQGLLAGMATGGGFQAVRRLADTMARQSSDEQQATSAAQRLGDLIKGAEASALRERNPEAFRDLLTQMADDGQVYVDAEVLAQMPPEVLAQMQGVNDELPAALAANGTVAVKIADAMTLLPGTPAADVFLQNARSAPDAPSLAETEAAGQQAGELLRQDADRILQQAQDQEAARQEFEAVRTDLATQINAAGRYRPAVSEAYAAGLAHFFVAYGARTGLGTQGMYDAYRQRGFRVSGQPTAQGDPTLESAQTGRLDGVEAFHFSAADRPTLSTGYYGTGLRGSARDEILNAPDTRLRERLSFYVDKGTGVRPESGVGGRAHRVRLDNVYDANLDPLKLRTGDARQFESRVLDAGFSGYLDRLDGTQPGQVVMLGPQTFTPELLGAQSRIIAADRVPALQRRDADWKVRAQGAPEAMRAEAERLSALPAWSAYEVTAVGGTLMYRPRSGVLEQRAAGDTRHQQRAQELLAAITPPRRSAVALMRGEQKAPVFANLFELSRWFTEKNRRGAEDMNDAAVKRRMLDALYADTLMALTDAGNAVGWYDAKVKAALDIMAQVHPEIATDPEARFGFVAILAITSNQTRVNENFELADALYTAWRADQKFPTDVGSVMDTHAKTEMSKSLAKMRDLVAQHGWETVRDFMTTKQTVREIETFTGYPVTGESKDSVVYGAVFLGPKIGAFFNNLYGNFDTVTMDRWFMRTVNRIRGSMLELPGSFGDLLTTLERQVDAATDTYGVNPDAIRADIAAFRALPVEQQGDILVVAPLVENVAEYAKARHKAYAKTSGKGRGSYGDSTPENVLAKNLDLALHQDVQTPRGGSDRNLMRELVLRLQQKLQSDGIDLVVADIQAALWYYEKDLVAKLRGKTGQAALFDGAEQEAEDYETAARRVLAARGRDARGSAAGPAGRARPAAAAAGAVETRVDTTGDLFAQSGGVGEVRPQQTGDGGRRGDRAGPAPLPGAPAVEGATGPDPRLVAVAEQYARGNGIDLRRQAAYAEVDVARAERIAAAYEAMPHAPNDPKVKAAYEDLIRQTLAQYLALEQAGYRFWFIDPGNDPYKSPWDAMRDLRSTQSMGVFPTDAGFGTSDADISGNPLLADTGLQWPFGGPDGPLRPVTANDLFRAVHDAFGHGLEGAGFRAQGEENAWQAHVRLFTGPAVGAITSETRGQNSWLNFGPHGEKNRTAKVEDTVFADQKTGLMPEWTWTEGRVPDADGVLEQAAYHGTPHRGIDKFSTDFIGTGEGAQAYGWGLYFASSKEIAEFYRKTVAERRASEDHDYFNALQNLSMEADSRGAYDSNRPQSNNWNDGDLLAWAQKNMPDAPQTAAFAAQYKVVQGQLYEVQVPENDDLLDYDAPLKDQPPKVKAALEKLGVRTDVVAVVSNATGEQIAEFSTLDMARRAVKANNWDAYVESIPSRLTGKDAYNALERKLGSDKAASLALRDAGIPGLRYLDAGSRGAQAKGKSHNFVIFDESRVQKTGELYQQARGAFNPKTLELVLGENADLSTLWHEMGHFFLEVLTDIASQPNAPAQITGDYATFLQWAGLTDEQWRSATLDQKRDAHEKWARAVEQYVMEGKVPNKDLAPLMRRFSAWLKATYQSIKQFLAGLPAEQRPELNDDIRRVLDRMLATDEQIAQANEAAGLLPDEEADAAAGERLRKRSIADLKWTVRARDKKIKELQKQAAGVRKQIAEEVTAEANQLPEVRAKAALDALQITPEYQGLVDAWKAQREAAEKGERARLVADLYDANPDVKGLAKGQLLAKNKREIGNKVDAFMIGWDRENPKPSRPLNATDQDVATVADSFGFETVDAMLEAIAAFGSKQDYVDARTEQRMLEEHGDLMNDDALREAANEAVHNEARARSLATELRTQREMLNPRQETGKTTANGRPVTVNALVEAAKQFAANVVDRTPLRDLKNRAWQHTAAERRASRTWQQATAAGNTAEAVKAKQDQMLNNAAARAALDARTEVKRVLEFFGRVTKGNDEKTVERGRDPDIVNAARAVLSLYGVQTPASKTAAAYLEAVKRNDPETWSAIEPMIEAASANAQPLEALTFEELRGLHEQIEAMWFLAKRSRQMEVDGDLVDIEDLAGELADRMEAIGVPTTVPGESGALTRGEERTRAIRFFGAALKRVEQWTEGMDGKYGGPFLRYVFQPVKDAADRYRKDRIDYRKRFQVLVDRVAPTLKHGLIEAPELGYTFGRGHNGIGSAELLHAILHTGNDSNKRKLLLGRGWAAETPDGVLDTTQWDTFIQRMVAEGKLTQAHFDFAQGVWDLLEDTKPLAQKAHRDVFGRYFDEVTANAFADPFGVPRRGGYVPAQADPAIVQDADLRALAEAENESMAYSFPTTNRGFTKSRVEYNRPLKLDLRTIPQHLDKVLLFSHMEPAVRGVSRLLRQKAVSQPLGRIDQTAYSGLLLPWLHRAGKQIVETPVMGDGKITRVLSVLRARAGAALMFANVSNALQQVSGLSNAAVKVKPSHLMRAAANIVAHPKKAREAVWAASPYMADRASNEVAEMTNHLEAILLKPGVYERAQNWSTRHAYFLQTAFDNTLSPIVWTGAYNQAVEQGLAEQDAVRFADGVVRQTQGSTLPEDISRIESGPPYARLFTQFVGYFNMLANTNATALKQIAQETGLKRGAGRALYVTLMGLLVPIWTAEAIAQAFRGGPEDEDDDGYLDDWLAAVFGMGTIKGALAQVPFIGQLANAGINRANDNPTDDRVSLSPAVSLLEAGAGAPVSVYKAVVEEGSARKAIRDVASLVSLLTGLPIVALARPAGYAADVGQGRVEPTGPVDAARGVVTGTASPASR